MSDIIPDPPLTLRPDRAPVPPDLLTRFGVDLGLLFPPFALLLRQLVAACAGRGENFYVVCGFRDWPDQTTDFLVGRQPGFAPKGETIAPDKLWPHTVTDARAGQSLHQYGIAADLVRDANIFKPGLQPDWDASHYVVLREEAARLKLATEPRRGDAGHVGLDLAAHGLSIPALLNAYRGPSLNAQKMAAVFALLNGRGPWV